MMNRSKSILADPVREISKKGLSKLRKQFLEDGFLRIENIIIEDFVEELGRELLKVSRKSFSTGFQPDKQPSKAALNVLDSLYNKDGSLKAKKPKLVERKVCQWVNIWKASNKFKQLVHSSNLGKLVASLAVWNSVTDNSEGSYIGARVAQDQVWVKPPGSQPLVFHRDTPYFFFSNHKVVTVWVALDDMHEDLGPIEYVRGSHLWSSLKERSGSANDFFQTDVNFLLNQAAEESGNKVDELEFVSMKGLQKGGISIHDGNTWHGSMKNCGSRPRRGIGIHFVPGDVKFTTEALRSKLWRNLCLDESGEFKEEVDDNFIPLTSSACYINYSMQQSK